MHALQTRRGEFYKAPCENSQVFIKYDRVSKNFLFFEDSVNNLNTDWGNRKLKGTSLL